MLVRHAVTAQTGPLLSGRAPGIDLSETGVEQAENVGERLAVLPITAVYASPIERTQPDRRAHRRAPRPRGAARSPGVIEADYGEWTGGKIADLAKTDLWKTVQIVAVARAVPGRRVASPRCRAAWSPRSRQVVADHPGEIVVVVSHADPIKAAIAHFTGVHLDLFQRVDRVAGVGHRVRARPVRRRAGEVQRHR